MRKRSKKYTEAVAKINKSNVYTKEEAIKEIEKFDYIIQRYSI